MGNLLIPFEIPFLSTWAKQTGFQGRKLAWERCLLRVALLLLCWLTSRCVLLFAQLPIDTGRGNRSFRGLQSVRRRNASWRLGVVTGVLLPVDHLNCSVKLNSTPLRAALLGTEEQWQRDAPGHFCFVAGPTKPELKGDRSCALSVAWDCF